MRDSTYEFLAAREDEYWWHRARREMAGRLLKRYGVPPRSRWLDLGCGTGGNMRLLDVLDPGLAVGLDLSPIALGLAREKAAEARLVRADIARRLPFADSTFDLVTVFGVLNHAWVREEVAVLTEIRRVLRPTGLVLATEPAFAVLERSMDVVGMTRCRYRAKEFAGLCRASGLDVLFVSYFTCFGFPLILMIKVVKRLRAVWSDRKRAEVSIDLQPLSRVANECMFRIALVEAGAIARGICMPFGTTLVCVARKQ
jgi:ubiquinone/menaquinone biosynthesis C-methylase UbiE